MAQATTDKNKKPVRPGIPFTPEGQKEYEKAWQDMEDCFSLLDKQDKGRRKKK